jgi:hypothetical protein
MKETAQQLINQLKELVSSIQRGTGQQDIVDKRKQLQAVNKSIQQLERQNVAVPDDLRNLKTTLAAELGSVDHAEDSLRFIALQLKQMLSDIGFSITSPHDRRKSHSRRSNEPKTDQAILREYIIKGLKAHGGSARVREVLDWMEQELDDKLTPRDKQFRKSGRMVWKNNACWERFQMAQEGILKNDSPQGIWELSKDYQ